MKTPKISLGMPVFNGEPFIERAIETLLGQTFSDFELIISDNASTDGTTELCQSYARRDDRIRYSRNASNLGMNANFNRVASLANAEFFAFAASDDEWSPRFLEALIAIHERYPDVGLAHSSYDWIDERGDRVRMGKVTWLVSDDSPLRALLSLGRLKPWAYSFCLQYLWRNPFPFYGLFRRTALAPMLPFAERPSVRHGDNLFLLRFLMTKQRVASTPEVLFHYRHRARQLSDYAAPGAEVIPLAETDRAFDAEILALLRASADPQARSLRLLFPILQRAQLLSSHLSARRGRQQPQP